MAEEKKILATSRLPESALGKLKHIAWFDRTTYQAVIEEAAADYIKKWEKRNNEITPEQIKKALDSK